MQTSVHYNPYTDSWTRTRINVNAALIIVTNAAVQCVVT